MTVKELITRLSVVDPNLKVWITAEGQFGELKCAYIDALVSMSGNMSETDKPVLMLEV